MPRILIAAALAFLTTTAAAQEVSYDFDRSADFSTLKSYSWVRGTPLNDEFNHRRIVDARVLLEETGRRGDQRVVRRGSVRNARHRLLDAAGEYRRGRDS